MLGKASQIYDFFFGFWPLLIPPLLWPYRLKTLEERVTVFLLAVFLCVAIFPLTGLELHYVAPIAGLLYVRFLQTLSRLHGWRPAGKPLGPAVAVFFVTLFGYQFATNLSFMLHGGMHVRHLRLRPRLDRPAAGAYARPATGTGPLRSGTQPA